MTIDWWGNTSCKLLIEAWISFDLFKLFLIFFSNCWHSKSHWTRTSILIHARLNTENSDIALLYLSLYLSFLISTWVSLLFGDAENTNNLYSVSWCALVSELSINCKKNTSWHFTSWNQLWSFLKFDELLIEKLTTSCVQYVRILTAILFVWSWIFGIITDPWSCWTI